MAADHHARPARPTREVLRFRFVDIGDLAAKFTGTQNVESPFRIVLGGKADAPGGRLGGTFTLAGTGGRLETGWPVASKET